MNECKCNMNINNDHETNIFKITNYCENKLTEHELNSDPDVNYFNSINLPNSRPNYFNLRNYN